MFLPRLLSSLHILDKTQQVVPFTHFFLLFLCAFFVSQLDLYRRQVSLSMDLDSTNQAPGLPRTLELFDLRLAGKRIFAWWAGGCRHCLQRQMGSSTFHHSGWAWSSNGALAGYETRHRPWTSVEMALSQGEAGRTPIRP